MKAKLREIGTRIYDYIRERDADIDYNQRRVVCEEFYQGDELKVRVRAQKALRNYMKFTNSLVNLTHLELIFFGCIGGPLLPLSIGMLLNEGIRLGFKKSNKKKQKEYWNMFNQEIQEYAEKVKRSRSSTIQRKIHELDQRGAELQRQIDKLEEEKRRGESWQTGDYEFPEEY